MNGLTRRVAFLFVVCLAGLPGEAPADDQPKSRAEEGLPEKVVKTDEEWAKILTREQFYVTRQKGTERAFTGKYARYHGKGTFACVGCGVELFDARHKFESGTGWPSFYRPVSPARIETEVDYSMPSEVRTEVMCSTCGAHLGHVFNDGPRPTGLRFCINSVALKLVPPPAPAAAKTKPAPASKTNAAPKAKASPPKKEDARTTSDSTKTTSKTTSEPKGDSIGKKP